MKEASLIQSEKRALSATLLIIFSAAVVLSYATMRLSETSDFLDGFEFPKLKPAGIDLSLVLQASKAFLNHSNKTSDFAVGHPPFEIFVLMPLANLSHGAAFAAFGLILLGCFWASIYFSLLAGGGFSRIETLLLATLIFFGLFHTYPVLFAIERGNTDIIAAGLIFGVVGGFFILGLAPLKGFHQSILRLQNMPGAWQGNHSLASWTKHQYGAFFNMKPEQIVVLQAMLAGFFVLAVATYGLSELFKKEPQKRFEIVLCLMSFPLMSLLPGTSHDYRLPIYIVPFLFLVSSLAKKKNEVTVVEKILFSLIALSTGLLFSPFSFCISKTELILFLNTTTWIFFISEVAKCNFFEAVENHSRT